jgi:Uma2 family endonuclease
MGVVTDVTHFGSWTIKEWMQLNETPDGNRVELLDGSLLVSPAPSNYHQYAADELRAMLKAASPHTLRVVTAAGVELSPSTALIPDLVVMTVESFHGGSPVSATDVRLVVEVVSPTSSSVDRLTKPAKYAAAGIPNYWRIELEDFPGRDGAPLPVVLVHTRDGDSYRLVSTIAAGTPEVISEPFRVELDPAPLTDGEAPGGARG